jgi:protein involved in polysaccharide export with SLBB domain
MQNNNYQNNTNTNAQLGAATAAICVPISGQIFRQNGATQNNVTQSEFEGNQNQVNIQNGNTLAYPQDANTLANIQTGNSQSNLQNSNTQIYASGDSPRSTFQNNPFQNNPFQSNIGQPCILPNGLPGVMSNSVPGMMQGIPNQGMQQNGNRPIVIPRPEDVPTDEPQEIQRRDPYGLQSLHDLYTQIPSSGAKLRRFGSDAFVLGTGNTNELPMDLPVGPDYVLGSGDALIVNMWGGHSERLSLIVDRQGQITLPEAGTLNIDGMTIAQAQTAIQKSLSGQFQQEHVEISLGRLRTVRIYVVGDVQRPGAYDVSSLSTPLSALYAAGGPTSRGSLRVLIQKRGDKVVRTIDLYDFLLRGIRSNVDRLYRPWVLR